jgi:O-acetyl-ADP-ribose deacetylase
MNTTVRDTVLEIVVGDIAKLDVDAVVSAADSGLRMESGVGGAIKREGGEVIEREAAAQGPIEVGDAIATTGGGLKAKWVIHAALKGPGVATDANAIAAATMRALSVADRLKVRSVALPPFGVGVDGFPPYASASIMVGRVRQYLDGHGHSGLKRVVFSADDDLTRVAFKTALAGSTRFQ